jgi:hypothetical protein
MKIWYTILLFLNAAALTLMFIILFSYIDRHAGIARLLAIVVVILLLIWMLFYWLVKYFRMPSGRRLK